MFRFVVLAVTFLGSISFGCGDKLAGRAEKDVLSILQLGDPRLSKKSLPVETHLIDSRRMQILVRKMTATMRAAGGVGLSAIQVGVPRRVFTMEVTEDNKRYPEMVNFPLVVMFNPVLEGTIGSAVAPFEEGCLSIPDTRLKIWRFQKIIVSYHNERAERVTTVLSGHAAIIFQHELDHLNGILIPERQAMQERDSLLDEYR